MIYTYIFTSKSLGLTKIGRSKQPKTRLAALKTMARDLEPVALYQGDREKELHAAHQDVRESSEWFRLSDQALNRLEANADIDITCGLPARAEEKRGHQQPQQFTSDGRLVIDGKVRVEVPLDQDTARKLEDQAHDRRQRKNDLFSRIVRWAISFEGDPTCHLCGVSRPINEGVWKLLPQFEAPICIECAAPILSYPLASSLGRQICDANRRLEDAHAHNNAVASSSVASAQAALISKQNHVLGAEDLAYKSRQELIQSVAPTKEGVAS